MAGMAVAGVDGRVARGARNREAIVEALLALYRAGTLAPTAQHVAERAGVAPRSVYHHFADMEDLVREVSDRQLRAYGHLMEQPDVAGPLAQRVEALVERRAELFEAVAPVRRAALLSAHRSPTIRRNLAQLARRLRRQVEQLFEPELAARRAGERDALLDAADLLLSWEAWERLRTTQQLSAARAQRVTAAALTTLLRTEEDR